MKTLLGLMLFVLLLPRAARAEAPDSAVLRPYVDSQTLAVGHLDTAKVDLAAIDTFVQDVLASARISDSDPLVAEIRPGIAQAKGVLEKFTKFGGRHVYLLVSHTDLWPYKMPGAALIPLEAGGDEKGMVDFLRGMNPEHDLTIAPLRKDLIFVGDEATFKRMQGMKAEPRPDVEAALAAAPASALQLVVVPTADERRALEELMPRLPEGIGGGSIEPLAHGVKSVTLSVDLPPALAATLRVDGESAEVSRRVADLFSRGIAAISGALPRTGKDPLAARIAELLDALKPRIDGSAVLIQLQANQVKNFQPLMGLAFSRWRTLAGRQHDAANLRDIAQACIVWAANHKGPMPDHLGRLLLSNQISPAALVMSGSGTKPLELTEKMKEQAKGDFAAFAKLVDAHSDVAYLGKGTTSTIDSTLVLAYQKPGPYCHGEITMVFTDAHTEVVRLSSLADVLQATNAYRKKINLPAVDAEAIIKAAKDQGN